MPPSQSIEMIKEMIEIGNRGILLMGSSASSAELDGAMPPTVAAEAETEENLFVFHVPPFNSIDHLHLHVIGSPSSMSYSSYFKYALDWGWCASAKSVLRPLERMEKEKEKQKQQIV